MAHKGSSRRKSHRHRHGRKHRGGSSANPASYSSASTYGMAVNGSGDSQFNRVFSQSGMDSRSQSNTIVGVQGQNAGIPATLAQKAGGKRSTSGKRSKKGGFWGQIINQAVVPFGILGLQQTYKGKRSGGGKTRRHRRR
jgi:hypothetical protein